MYQIRKSSLIAVAMLCTALWGCSSTAPAADQVVTDDSSAVVETAVVVETPAPAEVVVETPPVPLVAVVETPVPVVAVVEPVPVVVENDTTMTSSTTERRRMSKD